MLAKKQRLTRTAFSKYFKLGKRYHSPVATMIVTPGEQFHGAVVVGKKVHKKAVTRNKIRRRAYAQLYNAFKKKNNGVYILLMKPAILSLTRTEQHKQIAQLIAQVN